MRQLLEFIPLVLFFAAYKLGDIYIATAVLMGATCVQMAIIYALDKKLTVMHKVTLGMIVGFGALTLALHDERFVKAKPTVLYAGMALALAVALWGFRKNVLQTLLGGQLRLPDPVWRTLTKTWIVYFLAMGALNAYVALSFSTDFWVSFKLWGYAFPFVFLVGQGIYISRHMLPDEVPNELPNAAGDALAPVPAAQDRAKDVR